MQGDRESDPREVSVAYSAIILELMQSPQLQPVVDLLKRVDFMFIKQWRFRSDSGISGKCLHTGSGMLSMTQCAAPPSRINVPPVK
jgi:hypothetical protein